MRAFLILIAVVVVAGIGWFLFGAGDAPMTEDAAAPAAEAAGDAAPAAAPAGDAAPATTEAAGDAVETATEEVGTAVEGAAATAAETATTAVEGVGDALAGALTVDGFDAAKVREAIAASGLDDAQKQSAEALVQSAEQNPALVQSVIDQLKPLLGL